MKPDRQRAEAKEFLREKHGIQMIDDIPNWHIDDMLEFASQQRLSRERVMDILEAFDMYLRKVYGEIKFNYDDAMRFVMNNDLCEGEEQPTDEEIINHIIKNCRHKEPPEIMMDEQAYFEGAKAMRDKQIKTN